MTSAFLANFRQEIDRSRRFSALARILVIVAFVSEFILPLVVLAVESSARVHGRYSDWGLYLIAPDPKFDPVMNQYPEQIQFAKWIPKLGSLIILAMVVVAFILFWRRATSFKRLIKGEQFVELESPPLEFVGLLNQQAARLAVELPRFCVLWKDDDSYGASVIEYRGVPHFIVSSGLLLLCRRKADFARMILSHELGHVMMRDSTLWLSSINSSAVLRSLGFPLAAGVALLIRDAKNFEFWLLMCLVGSVCFYAAPLLVFALRRRSERLADIVAVSVVGVDVATEALRYVISDDLKSGFSRIHPRKDKRIAFLNSAAISKYVNGASQPSLAEWQQTVSGPSSTDSGRLGKATPAAQQHDTDGVTVQVSRRTRFVRAILIGIGALLVFGSAAYLYLPHRHFIRYETEYPSSYWIISSIAWSPDGQRLLTGSSQGIVELKSADGKTIWRMQNSADRKDVATVAWSADAGRILAAESGRSFAVRSAADGEAILSVNNDKYFSAAALSPDGTVVATAGFNTGDLKWWLVRKETITSPAQNILRDDGPVRTSFEPQVTMLVWRPDGRQVAAAMENGMVDIVDVQSRNSLLSLPAHDGFILSVDWSADGKSMITSGSDETAKIWDTSDYHLLRIVDLKARGMLQRVAVSGDGLWLATMTVYETNIWNFKTGRLVVILPSSSVGSWRPGGSELALSEPNAGLGLWSMGNALLLRNRIGELFR